MKQKNIFSKEIVTCIPPFWAPWNSRWNVDEIMGQPGKSFLKCLLVMWSCGENPEMSFVCKWQCGWLKGTVTDWCWRSAGEVSWMNVCIRLMKSERARENISNISKRQFESSSLRALCRMKPLNRTKLKLQAARRQFPPSWNHEESL